MSAAHSATNVANLSLELRLGQPLPWTRLLRLWDDPKKFPQTAILLLTNSEYRKISEDPKSFVQFVNKNRFFGKDVICVGPWVSVSSVDQMNEPPAEWLLTLVHGKKSTMIVSALPHLNEEDQSSKWASDVWSPAHDKWLKTSNL